MNELDELKAERDELREALRALLHAQDEMVHHSDYLPGERARVLYATKQHARALLSKPHPDKP